MAVRPAQPGDAAAVAAILAEAFPSLYRAAFGELSIPTWAAILESLFHSGTLTLAQTRVAERDGRVVGVCILQTSGTIGHGGLRDYWRGLRRVLGFGQTVRAFSGGLAGQIIISGRIPRAPDLAYIEALAVTETERGHGIGTLLLREALRWTEEAGRSRIALHVLETNAGAQRLYEREGFREAPPSWARPGLFGRRSAHRWGALLMGRHTSFSV